MIYTLSEIFINSLIIYITFKKEMNIYLYIYYEKKKKKKKKKKKII